MIKLAAMLLGFTLYKTFQVSNGRKIKHKVNRWNTITEQLVLQHVKLWHEYDVVNQWLAYNLAENSRISYSINPLKD